MKRINDHPVKAFGFFKQLIALPFVKRAILYGSRARGDAQERSDIDIALDCPEATERDWLHVVDIVDNAETLLKIDCVRYDSLRDTNPLKGSIDKEGIILYEKTMIEDKLLRSFENCEKALEALHRTLNKLPDEDRDFIDSTIHRFEFTLELFWKLLKQILAKIGKPTLHPRQVLQEAYATELIDDEKLWLSMLDARNETSHTYDEDMADTVYEKIKIYYPVMQSTFDKLVATYKKELE